MGVGLVRSLQPPDILWIHWRVYKLIANTNKGVLFLPPSNAYVRSFLCLLYTLIKLYYTKALSDQALSLAPDRILLLRGPRILVSIQQRPFNSIFDFIHLHLRQCFEHLDVLIWYQGSWLQSCFLIISALLKSNPSRIYRNPS